MQQQPVYYVRRPNLARKSFSIYKQLLLPDGSTKNETLAIKNLEIINLKLKRREISFAEANTLAEGIKARLAGTVKLPHNAQNQHVLKQFLDDYFKQKRFLVDQTATRTKYERAVRALGELSVLTVTADEALDKILKLETNSQQREAANKLNSMFKRLGRNVIVSVPPLEHQEVKYVTEQEVAALIKAADPQFADAIEVSFYAGPRIGELRALKSNALLGTNIINILTQVDRTDTVRLPKNRKRRKAYIAPQAVPAFKRFVGYETNLEYEQYNDYFKRLTYQVLGRNDLTWHDLRHSYAVYLLSQGVPVHLVAQSMGNSEKVVRENYAGFIIADAGIETISRIMSK